ncbi:AAA family ATPase [Streptosporangiaceae bacterium NEAU-GS5]|nr:AAA family ATPase [Streptosporangiaceae bacterium NEAU-GS5]
MAVRLCPVLVGRDREMGELRAALAGARAGRAGTHLVVGVAGVGKSRMVAQLLSEATAHGMATLRGRAVETERPEAFRPVTEALLSVLRTLDPDDLAQLSPYRPAIGRLVPEWAGQAPMPEVSLVVLAEGVLRLLAAVAGHRGALIVLEDVHWADPETLGVLEYLADNLRAERIACVATLRPEPGSPAYALARRLVSRRSATLIQAPALTTTAVRDMARLCLGLGESDELPAALERLVLSRAEGLPLLVEDLLATTYESGLLLREDTGWKLVEQAARVIPRDFADTVRRRAALLPDAARTLLNAAAVLGVAFDWPIAAETAGVAPATAVDELRRAVAVQLLRVDEGEDGPSFRFHHALTRDAIWSALPADDRRLLSERALTAVEARHPGLPGEWCDLAATLSERAGRAPRAAALLLRSGRRALDRGALSTAEQVLQRASDLAAGSGDQESRTAAGQALTEVLALAGKTDEAFRVGNAVLDQLATTPALAGAAERQVAVCLWLARSAIGATRWAAALRHLDHARELEDACAGALPPARIDVMAAQVAMGEGRLEDAVARARSALDAAYGAPDVACEALIILGRRARLDDLDAADRLFAQAHELAERHSLPYWTLQAMHELGTVEVLSSGRVGKLLRAREMALASGALATVAILDLQLAGGHHARFDPVEGLKAATRAVEAARRFQLGHALPMALVSLAGCQALAGRRAEMEAALGETASIAPGDPAAGALAWGHCRALSHLLHEERAEAATALDTAMAYARRTPAGPPGVFRGLWALVRTLQDAERAHEARQEVRDSGAAQLPLNAGVLGYADAVALGREGDPAAAGARFATADAIMASWEGGDGLRHLARRLAAEAALQDGWGAPATWLREAATYFAGTPHHPITGTCQALLRAAGQPVPRLTADVPGELRAMGVTEREADVLMLVGMRLSNRQIADRLVLSPRTVEKHVERLLAKTGMDNRVALAGLAERLRLKASPDT